MWVVKNLATHNIQRDPIKSIKDYHSPNHTPPETNSKLSPENGWFDATGRRSKIPILFGWFDLFIQDLLVLWASQGVATSPYGSSIIVDSKVDSFQSFRRLALQELNGLKRQWDGLDKTGVLSLTVCLDEVWLWRLYIYPPTHPTTKNTWNLNIMLSKRLSFSRVLFSGSSR